MTLVKTWGVTGVLILMVGCAGPVPGLWPPPPDSPTRVVVVSVDSWHAMIAFPRRGTSQPLLYEEWGYAEQAWYLEGAQGPSGVLRALFWPSPGVVEVGYHEQPWSERTPQPPAQQFQFQLSEDGYARLRAYLRSSLRSHDPILATGGSEFYPARRAYTVFNHCHHYAARALREAGLPVSAFWALTRSLLAAQLRRAERLAAEPHPGLPAER